MTPEEAMETPMGKRLPAKELAAIDAWWRAANYLSVGQIYLLDNPLLKELLRTYVEGTYSEFYPNVSQEVDGMQRLFKQFSFPGLSRGMMKTSPHCGHRRTRFLAEV